MLYEVITVDALDGIDRRDAVANVGLDRAFQAEAVALFQRGDGLGMAIDQVDLFQLVDGDTRKRPELQPQALDQRHRNARRVGAVEVAVKCLVVEADVVGRITSYNVCYTKLLRAT